MAKYYNYIDDTVGLGATTIADIQTKGGEYGIITSQDINARVITASQFVGPGIGTEGGVYTPYTIWVSTTGDDGYSGITRAAPKRTIKGAIGVATEGTIIRVSPGTYVEDNPITIPSGVSIEGDNLRNCVVSPSNDDDLFYVNDGCYIGDLSFSGAANSNAIVSFDPTGVGVITKSPYIRNCTNFIPNSIGMRIDGSLANNSNGVNGSMVCDSYTQYNQGGIGVTITNNAYAQLVSIFTICCDTAIFTGSGGQCDITNSNSSFGNFGLVSSGVGSTEFIGSVYSSSSVNDNEIVVSGVGSSRPYSGQVVYFGELYYNVESITVTDGGSGYSIPPVVTISSPTGPNSIAAQAFATIENGSVTQVNIISSGSNYRLSDSPTVSFSTGTASATVNLSPLYYKVRSATLPSSGITTVTLSRTFDNNIGIGSIVPFSRQSLQIVSSHSFEYIGSGTDILVARPSLGGVTITENEIVKLNGGDIVYTSTDQDGNFKIGDGVIIDQAGGVISGRSFDKSILSKVTPFILALS